MKRGRRPELATLGENVDQSDLDVGVRRVAKEFGVGDRRILGGVLVPAARGPSRCVEEALIVPLDLAIGNLGVSARQSGSAVDVSQDALHVVFDDGVFEIEGDRLKIASFGARELDHPERRWHLGAEAHRKSAATSLGREVCADISEAVANGQAIGQVDDGDDAIRPLVRPGAEVSCLDALYQHLLDEAPVALELKFLAPGFEVRDVDAGDVRLLDLE